MSVSGEYYKGTCPISDVVFMMLKGEELHLILVLQWVFVDLPWAGLWNEILGMGMLVLKRC